MSKNINEINNYKNVIIKNYVLRSILESELKTQDDLLGGAKFKPKCDIEKTDKIFVGSGGSDSLIIITKTKRVFKMLITAFFSYANLDALNFHKQENIQRVNNEIEIYRKLTKYIVNTNITPHFVKLIESHNCDNVNKLFSDCKTFDVYLEKSNKNNKCKILYQNFPAKQLTTKYPVIEIEYCPGDCAKLLENISTEHINSIKESLDKLFFQIAYTLCATQKKFKYFVHYDLFIRNVLGTFSNDKVNYCRYKINGFVYDVPVLGFCPKISDFGMTNLDKTHHDRQLEISELNDFFNFVLDVYDGGNLGSASMSTLFIKNKKDSKKKLEFLDSYFSTFFNIKKIKKLLKVSRNEILWNWTILRDDDLRRKLKVKTPTELLSKYFVNIFPFDESHKIVDTFESK